MGVGFVLRAGKMRSQCLAGQQKLKTENRRIRQAKRQLAAFPSGSSSDAMDSLHAHIDQYMDVFDALLAANEQDQGELGQLSALVGEEDLVEEEIRRDMASFQELQQSALYDAGVYSAYALEFSGTTLYDRFSETAAGCRLEAENYQEQVRLLQQKLEKYYEIEAATSGLLTTRIFFSLVAGRALGELEHAYDSGSHIFSSDNYWIRMLKNTDSMLTEYGETYAFSGLTEEDLEQAMTMIKEKQLENMEGLGYSSTESISLLAALIKEGTAADVQAYRYLMNRTEADYRKLFQMDPTDLSDSMDLLMADYAARLVDRFMEEAETGGDLDGEGTYSMLFQAFHRSIYSLHECQNENYRQTYADSYLQRQDSFALVYSLFLAEYAGMKEMLGGEADMENIVFYSYDSASADVFSVEITDVNPALYRLSFHMNLTANDTGDPTTHGFSRPIHAEFSGYQTLTSDAEQKNYKDYLNTMQKTQEQLQTLKESCRFETAKSVYQTLMSAIHPMLGIIVGIGMHVESGKYSSLDNDAAKVYGKLQGGNGSRGLNLGISMTNNILDGVESFYSKKKALQKQLRQAAEDMWLEEFGTAATVHSSTNASEEETLALRVMDPDTAMSIYILSTQGLEGLIHAYDPSLDASAITESIYQEVDWQDITASDAERFLYGSGSQSILDMDAATYTAIAEKVNDKLKELAQGPLNYGFDTMSDLVGRRY